MVAYALDQFRGAYAVLGFRPEGFLYYAVLQAVVADNDQPTSGLEGVYGLLQSGPQIIQLAVDGYAKGLEGARGRVYAATGRSDPASDDLRQVCGASERPILHQCPCDDARTTLLSIGAKEVGEFLLVALVDDGCRRGHGCGCVEAHVQGLFPTETEATA